MAQTEHKDPRYERTLRNPFNWWGEEWLYTNKNTENLIEGTVDITVQIQMALSAILRGPQSVSSRVLVDTLCGLNTKLVVQSGMNKIKTFGVGRDTSHNAWHIILNKMQSLNLIRGVAMYQQISVVESYIFRTYLRGEQPVTLSVTEFRTLERERAIKLLTTMLTERDPDGKTERSTENRAMITPEEAEIAEECYAILKGELSMVIQHITHPVDALKLMIKNTITETCVRDNIDRLETAMIPSSSEIDIISSKKPQSISDLVECFGKPRRWFEKFADPIIATVIKHELLIADDLDQKVVPRIEVYPTL
jgi:superfamily II DNA helicase RecQ